MSRPSLIGVRGAATGPRTNLENADTGLVVHQLFVKIVGANSADQISRQVTLNTLQYIKSCLPQFEVMGIKVVLNQIKESDLSNERLIAAMRARGVTKLPAMTSPNDVYNGLQEIKDVYEKNIRQFAAIDRRGERPVVGTTEHDLSSYYEDEMTFERAEEDAQETGIGETDDMMENYRRFMEKREATDTARNPQRRTQKPAAAPAAHEPRRAPRDTRPVVAPPVPKKRAPVDEADAEIELTISRLARDIDDSSRKRAFEGSVPYDEDDGANAQDDLMEAAYWGRSAGTEVD